MLLPIFGRHGLIRDNKLIHDLIRLEAPFCQLMTIQGEPQWIIGDFRGSLVRKHRLMNLSHFLKPLDLFLSLTIMIILKDWWLE